MRNVSIGVCFHSEPRGLSDTLASLAASTPETFDLLILADGPDPAAQNALAELRHLASSATARPMGTAACFNRLAALTNTEVIVLIESGVQVGPEWLKRLLEALDEHPANGLAGPSTNISWNEQGAFPAGGSSLADISKTASEAISRFAGKARTLEPLYSLADFCYAVRREVVQAIGAADEDYGLGPCWEMDYNIRAARAGFRGVWAAQAYVHRAPISARRRIEETRWFERSKHLYQDKFCGGRLRGIKPDYRTHCRGDDCPNFAPTSLIAIQAPFNPAKDGFEQIVLSRPADKTCEGSIPTALADAPDDSPAAAVAESQRPFASCIMPTFDRPDWIAQAINYFLRQDYRDSELIILDDGSISIADWVPEDPRIRYVRLERKLSVGAKRNIGCEMARGDVIVHWDDDDWYSPSRISRQVRALVDNNADICGTSSLFYYKPASDQAWEYRYLAPGKPWVGGNTLAYRKSFWEKNRFEDIQIGEDSRFVFEGPARKVCDLADPSLCIATVHDRNTSPKDTAGAFWLRQPAATIHGLLGPDVHFYRTMFDLKDWPLVSCIMPTYNRRPFVSLALSLFAAQDYPNKELIVVDDGEHSVADLAEGVPGVTYVRLSSRLTIGAKRNMACSLARGEVVAHWDDDDWYSFSRLRYQVMPILRGETEMTGLENSCVLELPAGRFWTTTGHLHQRMFVGDVHGGTLTFKRSIFNEGIRYPEVNLAEDALLLQSALAHGKRLIKLPNPGLFVYVRHGRNAWRECQPGQFIDPGAWLPISRPPTFSLSSLNSYCSAVS